MKKKVLISLGGLCLILLCLLLIIFLHADDSSNVKEAISQSYAENQILTGDFDEDNAVKCVNGTFVGSQKDGVLSFKGIPYAKAPIGSLRWKDPEPVDASDSVHEALYYGKSGIQTEAETERASYYRQGEDCLTLNIWTSDKAPMEPKPVMVFIHGGSYGWGGTTDPLYDAQNFVKEHNDVIFVTINYRIGIMGFMDFTQVEGGEAYKTSGNLGLLDQKCALEWIQANIANFGGDPGNVTIIGESAGAGSVSLLPLMEGTKGLFQRIIAESGSVALTYSKDECLNLTQMLLKETKSATMNDLLALSEEELIQANENLNLYNNFPERDGIVIPENLYQAYEDGLGHDVDMLIGTNRDEVRYWIGEVGGLLPYCLQLPVLYENNISRINDQDMDYLHAFMNTLSDKNTWKLTEFYTEIMFRIPAIKQASSHSENGGNTYMYYWTYPSAKKHYGACHAVELAYVFNNLDETIYTGDNIDPALAKEVQTMWVNFAKTGNPSTDNHIWDAYDSQSRQTMFLGSEIKQVSDPLRTQRENMEPLLHYHFNGNYSRLNFNVPFVRKILSAIVLTIIIVVLVVRLLKQRKTVK